MRQQEVENSTRTQRQVDAEEANGLQPDASDNAVSGAPTERARGLCDVWRPQREGSPPGRNLAEAMQDRRLLTAEQTSQAVELQKKSSGKRLSEVLIDMGVDEAAVQEAVASAAGVPFERVDPSGLDQESLESLTVEYCRANGVLPLHESGTRLVIGVTDPRRLFTLDEVRRKLNRPIKVILITRRDLSDALESRTEGAASDLNVDDILNELDEDEIEVIEDIDETEDLEKQASESPVIRFVNYLIWDATKNGASDIHIEPQEKKLRVRYRVDGVLHESINPPRSMHAAIVSRLKIMANLDIAERRLPQDGRIRAIIQGRNLDLRLSTLPTSYGEKAVMRILDSRSIQITLEQLGMPDDVFCSWEGQIAEPHGIILVTGPTGSGKTTTLYSSLNQMSRSTLNISTVEDPIEYHLAGINQVQTHEKIGMSFAAALRSLLRQDPDVVMVGEIRDEETAAIAVQAALTGHLVLSTLHTNDAPSAITRLFNIGVEPFLIASAVNAVLAQRLVRRICENCKKNVPIDARSAKHLESHGVSADETAVGEGCDKCRRSGYSGRVGIYELLVVNDLIRDATVSRPNVAEFRQMCIRQGMNTLRTDGFRKVAAGLTTVEEVIRATQSD